MVDDYMKERPNKYVFTRAGIQEEILAKCISEIKPLIPRNKIGDVRLFGSLAKQKFGRYDSLWKGRMYSDVDVLIIVPDGFTANWKIHFKPEHNLWCVYDICNLEFEIINDGPEKLSIELQFIIVPVSNVHRAEKEAEKWGIPLRRSTKHKYVII